MKKTLNIMLLAFVAASVNLYAVPQAPPAPLPQFMDKEQLAQWSASQAAVAKVASSSQDVSTQFYTGKPYVADAGGYVFKYRTYNPEMSRWTSADPSGFPDGVNNQIYVNGYIIIGVDPEGKNIYMITNPGAVGGLGHSAMISGSGSSYTYQSYPDNPNNAGGTGSYTSLSAAMQAAAATGYTDVNEWDTTAAQDAAAQAAMSNFANSTYNAVTNNCQTTVNAALQAAGVSYFNSNIPDVADYLDATDPESNKAGYIIYWE
jgi:RHS repeat-associated protein